MSDKKHKCDHCDYKHKYLNRVQQHLWIKHNINTNNKYKLFECDNCDFKTKHNGCLGLHKWIYHDINTYNKYKLHECERCGYKTKHPGHFKDHVKKMHTDHLIEYNCNICIFKSKYLSSLDLHNWIEHNINKSNRYKIHKCSQCDYTDKIKGNLEKHLWCVHNINTNSKFKYYECGHCEYKFKSNGRLNRHLWYVHNININGKYKFYKCDHCEYKFKSNDDLKIHIENVHDTGDKVCDYCRGNCFRRRPYKDKNMGKVNICNKCYRKVTGYECRAEEDMVNCLKNNKIISPFIVSTDKIINNDSCNTKRRPDILLSSGDLHIIIECDEKQHQHYSPICESGRIDEILDEFKSGKVVFIRWNPDYYKVEKEEKKLNRKERLNKLEETIINISYNPPKEHIKIIYMFYNQDNPVIVDRWNKEFIY